MDTFLEGISSIGLICLIAIISIVSLGFFVICKTFTHMNKGFGPNNIKIIGILMVTILSSILAITMQSGESAAIGILGAIVGYLFGYDDKTNTPT